MQRPKIDYSQNRSYNIGLKKYSLSKRKCKNILVFGKFSMKEV